MIFSIITVSYNSGEKLRETLESVARQTCGDYEVIVKDGGSRDGSTDFLKQEKEGKSAGSRDGSTDFFRQEKEGEPADGLQIREAVGWREFLAKVRLMEGEDAGIYDAMNRAMLQARGEFILFLNCGDLLADREVLERAARAAKDAGGAKRLVLYGDTFSRKTEVLIASPPRITGFTCYRNIPCHQACFYSAVLCREKPFDLRYVIRADYDHFLWCFYQGGAEFVRLDFPVCSYEGGGYSERRENLGCDRQEHRQITSIYMRRSELFRYRTAMALTLAPLRRRMADSRLFSGLYHRLKDRLYQRRKEL